jgi:hypothetical protein
LPRSRPLSALTTAAVLAGCSYDWAVGPVADAGLDAGGHDAGGHDAGGHDAGPDCASLAASLDSARKQAKSCTIGMSGQCAMFITDECGCKSYVTLMGSAEANAFASAVQAFEGAGCKASCATCITTPSACQLVGGMGPYCVP